MSAVQLQAHAVALARSPWGLAAVGLGGALAIGLLSAAVPDVTIAIAMTPVVITWLTFLLYRKVARHPDAEFLLPRFQAGLVLRVVSVFAQLAVGFLIYRGEMDYVSYVNTLVTAAERIVTNREFDRLLDPAFVQATFGTYSVLVLFAMLGTMMLFVGPNIVAVFLVGAPISAAAAYLFYRAYESVAPDAASRRRFAKLMFLFPSLAFWSVFLGKDVWIILFLACTALALVRVLESVTPGRLLVLLLCVYFVFMLRSHVGGPLAVAVAAALCFRPIRVRGPALYLKPLLHVFVTPGGMLYLLYFVSFAALSRVGVTAMTIDDIAGRAYAAHVGFVYTQGGAALPQVMMAPTPIEALKFLPIGIGTFLFRPFVWEAHNAVALVAGLENLVFLGICIVRLPTIWQAIRLLPSSPFMVFVTVFLTITSIALSFEWNLGATQRHRAMVLPFLFMILALPRKRAAAEAPA
jgi:hypothetical protein